MTDTRYWSREFLTQFIEVYRANPCLWHVKSKDYTNKNLKNEAYSKLVSLCKKIYPAANRDFVVKKIQSLRGSFRKELKKVTESKRSVNSEKYVHTPSLWYFDMLQFTKEQEQPVQSISSSVESIKEELEEESSESLDPPTGGEEGSSRSERESDEAEGFQSPQIENSMPSYFTGMRKRKMTGMEGNVESMKVCSESFQGNGNCDIHEYDAVGVSVAAKLKRMDPIQAIYAESLISKVLFRGLLKRLTAFTDISEQLPSAQLPSNCNSDYLS